MIVHLQIKGVPVMEFYSPDQQRDDHGRWGGGGGDPIWSAGNKSEAKKAEPAAPKPKLGKFVRGYTRGAGNNIWHSGHYTIERSGSAYWGWTGYNVSFKKDQFSSGSEKLADAVKIANEHWQKQP